MAAHRKLSVYEGDVPTLVRVYEQWVKAKKDREWCLQHYVNGRSMKKGYDIREQLAGIMKSLAFDTGLSCGPGMSTTHLLDIMTLP